MAYDPYSSSIVLALPMDGTDGSTVFTDLKGKTVTPAGNAKISTAQSKYGGASGYFDGSGDYLETPSHTDFDLGSGAVTIEAWIYINSTTIRHTILIKSSLPEIASFALYIVNNQFEFNASSNSSSWDIINSKLFGVITAGTWTHVAVTRNVNDWRFFQDGVQQGSVVVAAGTLVTNTKVLRIGGQSVHYLNGYIDDLRITKGVARYTATFTPPLSILSSWTSRLAATDQPYEMEAVAIKAAVEQLYHLPVFIQTFLDQVYGLKLAAAFSQFYGDVPKILAALTQYYGDAYTVKKALLQLYGDALALKAIMAQGYSLPAELAAVIEQRFGISGAALTSVVDQLWAIKNTDTVLTTTSQPFGLLGDPGQVLTYTVAVTVGGVVIDPLHVSIEASRDQYCLSCEIHCATQGDYLACAVENELAITINGEQFLFFVESRSRSRAHGSAEYVVRGLSRTALLDAPYALPVTEELSGMASLVVAALAPGLTIDWRTVDWFIPANTMLPSDQTPLMVIREIAHAAGAIVQTAPDGTLIIEPDYPLSVTAWQTAPVALSLSDSLDFFSTSETFDHRPGFNRYLISDQLTSQDTVRLEEETLSETVKKIRGFKVPWTAAFDLRHTGGDWVSIEPLPIEAVEKSEVVEMVAGEGRTKYPIYGLVDMAWLQVNLGVVTHGEDGRLVSAVEGESLLAITYTTKCKVWQVSNPKSEQVQFVAEEL